MPLGDGLAPYQIKDAVYSSNERALFDWDGNFQALGTRVDCTAQREHAVGQA